MVTLIDLTGRRRRAFNYHEAGPECVLVPLQKSEYPIWTLKELVILRGISQAVGTRATAVQGGTGCISKGRGCRTGKYRQDAQRLRLYQYCLIEKSAR